MCIRDSSNDVLHLADEGFKQISVEPVVAAKDTGYDIREEDLNTLYDCLLYTSPSPRDRTRSRMPSSA